MNGYFIVTVLCVLGAHALPKPATEQARVGGIVPIPAPMYWTAHACMILVHRASLVDTSTAALGSGSIISTRHVLTAAHLVQGEVLRYQVGFIVGTSRRLIAANFRLTHEDYDNSDFSNDIALLFLQETATFPMASAITISSDSEVPADGTSLTAVGFGFTSSASTGASADPYAALQVVVETCEFPNYELSNTHFCAIDPDDTTWICPGDNGAGSFIFRTPDQGGNVLVGLASRILPGCNAPQNTGYTIVGLYVDWISNITQVAVTTFIANLKKVHNLH